jgi:PknH-like extracellular domain
LTTLRGVRVLPKIVGVFAALSVAFAPQAAADAMVSPGKVGTLLLSDDDVSAIVGLPLHRDGQIYPAPSRPAPPEPCKVLVVFDSDLWTGEFLAYRQVRQADNADNPQFLVQQFIAAYPKPSTAAQTYRHSFPSDLVNRCGTAVLPDPIESHAQWRIDGVTVTGTDATWIRTELYDGQDITWRCSDTLRLRSNVMYQDEECQYGNGATLVTQMSDMTASRFP